MWASGCGWGGEGGVRLVALSLVVSSALLRTRQALDCISCHTVVSHMCVFVGVWLAFCLLIQSRTCHTYHKHAMRSNTIPPSSGVQKAALLCLRFSFPLLDAAHISCNHALFIVQRWHVGNVGCVWEGNGGARSHLQCTLVRAPTPHNHLTPSRWCSWCRTAETVCFVKGVAGCVYVLFFFVQSLLT